MEIGVVGELFQHKFCGIGARDRTADGRSVDLIADTVLASSAAASQFRGPNKDPIQRGPPDIFFLDLLIGKNIL